jgi:hypothetical protein
MIEPKTDKTENTIHWLVNFSIYQANWIICIKWGNTLSWVALLLLAVHFYISPCRKSDIQLIALVTVLGILLDGILKAIGFFCFRADNFPIPFWLIIIWMTLATLPNHSLAWLKDKTYIAGLLGMVGGPLAYWAGTRLGVASFNWQLLPSLLVLGILWGLIWPTIMFMSRITYTTNSTAIGSLKE